MFYPSICIPTTGLCRTEFALSLAHLHSMFATVKIFEGSPQQLHVAVANSTTISTNRERLVASALRKGCSHICFIDDDIAFAPGVMWILAQRQKPYVCCNYRMRIRKAGFTAMGLDMKRIETTAEKIGLEPCCYAGFGFSLIERQVFEKVPQPWFSLEWCEGEDEGGGYHSSEDVGFCKKVRAAGFEVLVDHDASKLIRHYGYIDYRWDETI